MIFSIRAAVAAVAGVALAVGGAHMQAGPVKIAYVDANALMLAAPGKAEAESTYAKEAGTADAELQRLGAEIDGLLQEYQKTEATLTATQKDAKQKIITDKRTAANARNLALQKKLNDTQEALMAPLREVIKKTLEDIRTEDGYTMIVDAAAVLAADKNLDITDRVVGRLRTLKALQSKGPVNKPAGVTKPPPPRDE